MHGTIINMVRSMVFTSGLPLNFSGDSADYAGYILNRSLKKANEGGILPTDILSKKRPVLSGIMIFGSPRTVHPKLITNIWAFT